MYDERLNDKMEDTKPDVAASAVERLVSCYSPGVLDSIKKSIAQLAEYTKAGRESLIRFGFSVNRMAECEYLRHHKKLPGSDRTKRLRKKRLKIVAGWFCKHLSKTN